MTPSFDADRKNRLDVLELELDELYDRLKPICVEIDRVRNAIAELQTNDDH